MKGNARAVLITGAFGGMGRATAEFLKDNGFLVFALDKTVRNADENIIPIKADITSEDSSERIAETVAAMDHQNGFEIMESSIWNF